MRVPIDALVTIVSTTALLMSSAEQGSAQASAQREWPMHSMERPRPTIVRPGPYVGPVAPPTDAIILFDGRTMDGWRAEDPARGAARWRIEQGAMQAVAGAGGIATSRAFGDVQLHVEWMAPSPGAGSGQDRGNSGVFLMGRYEVQILDSHGNDTYADGQAGAIYGQFPPMVNASRPAGEWQTFDIIFRRPRFDAQGRVTRRARMTVLHNGILIHDAVELLGPTTHQVREPYTAHPDRLPITLQDHGHPVRFRNIWVRPLEDNE